MVQFALPKDSKVIEGKYFKDKKLTFITITNSYLEVISND